ncbi:MAG: hypothetical protein CMF58_06055 [Lentimicrobiaceae bacterium]|nr:hypothetical protein [Lentimicrobiaceae bacterium]
MKIFNLIFASLILVSIAVSCNQSAKTNESLSSEEQKSEWTNKCMKFMESNGTEERNATDFCDCMLKKTSEKYSPEQAASITAEEERKLWESCDYTW